MPFLVSEVCFWPLTASITSEVKNDHAHVTTQIILNKFIEVNLSVGCVVWLWCCLFQPLTTSKTINKIYISTQYVLYHREWEEGRMITKKCIWSSKHTFLKASSIAKQRPFRKRFQGSHGMKEIASSFTFLCCMLCYLDTIAESHSHQAHHLY